MLARYNRSTVLTCYRNQFFITYAIDIETKDRHCYCMRTSTPHTTIASSLDKFTRELDKSPLTIHAYRTDIQQFITWLHANDLTVIGAHHVTRSHINEYLSYLADKGRTDTTRARKLVSLHLFFIYLVHEGVIPSSPTAKVKKPRRDRKPKHVLRLDEFQQIVGAARGNPRDYALLQLLVQAGIRVSEVIAIRLSELDLEHKMLTIHGKGSKERKIPLEKKVLHALQSYLTVRPKTTDQHLFLNYQGQGLSMGGVRKMVEKYARRAGITKKISCHGLYNTCATNRTALGMLAFCLRTPLGHERMRTSKKYLPIGTEEL
jgi:integrase/recombinase XerD